MSKSSFQNDVPWRASSSSAKPIPKIHHSPILRVSQNPFSDYAISIMRVSLFLTFHPLFSFKFSFLTFGFFAASRPYWGWFGWWRYSWSSWSWMHHTWSSYSNYTTWPQGTYVLFQILYQKSN